MLAEWEGLILSRPTVRRIWYGPDCPVPATAGHHNFGAEGNAPIAIGAAPAGWRPPRLAGGPGTLAGETIWYEDPARKQVHWELLVAGMERASQQGKPIDRPRVTEQPDFEQRFTAVVGRIGPGGLYRRQAARELDIGFATLKRPLDGQLQPSDQSGGGLSAPAGCRLPGRREWVGPCPGDSD